MNTITDQLLFLREIFPNLPEEFLRKRLTVGLQNKIPLDDIVNNLFLELEKTEPLSGPQNTSRFTQPNVNVNTSIPSQNTTNNQHTTIPTNNSDNSLLHSNQHNNKMGTTEDILESSALGVELISHDPMTWGDRTLTEDADFQLATKLQEEEYLQNVTNSESKVNTITSHSKNANSSLSLARQLQEVREAKKQEWLLQKQSPSLNSSKRMKEEAKQSKSVPSIRQQLKEAQEHYRNKWRMTTLGKKRVWTLSDIEEQRKFIEDTKAGGWTSGKFEQDRRHGIHTLSRLFETSTDPNLIGKQALELTNEFRKKYGLPPLKWHETLAQIGRKHSEDMGEGRVPFGHQGFNARVDQMLHSLSIRSAAENVAMNYGLSDVARVAVDGWIQSEGHRRNLLANHDYCGIGVYRNKYGAWYLTQLFVKM